MVSSISTSIGVRLTIMSVLLDMTDLVKGLNGRAGAIISIVTSV